MIEQDKEYLDKLFVNDVEKLQALGLKRDFQHYDRLQQSAIVRRLVLDELPLAKAVAKHYTTPLIVLVPRYPDADGNKPRADQPIPSNVLRYAPDISEKAMPPGANYYPQKIDEFLGTCQLVLPEPGKMKGRPISVRELIKFISNKKGGVHAERNLRDIKDGGKGRIDAETLHLINESVTVFSRKALYNAIGKVAERVWRATAPLAEEVKAAYGGDCSLE
jgi:hypothetical protein